MITLEILTTFPAGTAQIISKSLIGLISFPKIHGHVRFGRERLNGG